MVMLLVVKSIHPGLNFRFDVSVTYLRLIILSVVGDIPVDNEMTDFTNLKIKSIQSFRYAHRDRMCVHVFIRPSAYMCMSICVCTVWYTKKNQTI
jgi:hypothetical protein